MVHETLWRLGVFFGIFSIIMALEWAIPQRADRPLRGERWFTNLSIVFIDQLALRLLAFLMPLLAIGAALDAARLEIGFFNLVTLPIWLEGVLAILIFDFVIWGQHLVSHKVGFCWRFHKVHHSDADMDVTTALRFHPIEIAASMALKIGLVYLFGPAASAVLVFEVLLSATALFTHANILITPKLDRILRKVIVTPDMHRIHHAPNRFDHDSNYGFFLVIWDRLFSTYHDQAQDKDLLDVGLTWPKETAAKLGFVMWLPFGRQK
jgi:sterol desaturase/sphingolipid hydroxylase (fatty acid hydroxylase superfamily)